VKLASANKAVRSALTLYYLVLIAFLLAAFFPNHRIWGINWWAYYPLAVPITLFVLGLLAPLAARPLFHNEARVSIDISGRTYLLASVIVVLVFGLLFWLLRARTHFLGDGYMLLSELSSEQPLVKSRNYGGMVVPLWLASFSGHRSEAAVLLSYQIVAISAGIGFLIAAALSARALFERNVNRLLFLLGMASGGYMLLFFGYVENYALFVLTVAIFGLVGLLVALGKVNRFWILPVLGLAIFLHVFGVVLIPATVYLLVTNSSVGRRFARLPSWFRGGIAFLAVITAIMAFYHYYTTNYFFRFSVVPIVTDRFTIDGYTLFSAKHLADFVNLFALLLPGLPIVIAVLLFLPIKEIVRCVECRFLLILLVSALGTAFLSDPHLGMPRDWDLFAFAGVPLALGGYYLLLSNPAIERFHVRLVVLTVLLGALVLVPRVVAVVIPDIAIAHTRSYYELDHTKNRTARYLLVKYLDRTGRKVEARREMVKWETDFPERRFAERAYQEFTNNKYREAIPYNRQVIRINPMHYDAYVLLGLCFLRLNQNDSAQLYFEIADGINPYNAEILNNLGVVYLRKGLYDKAEDALVRSLEMDSTVVNSLVSLISLYIYTNAIERSFEYFHRLEWFKDLEPELPKRIGDSYLARGHYNKAAAAYRLALERGLDSTIFSELMIEYPQLAR